MALISDYCELCGKEVIYPNYVVRRSQGFFNEFIECASCELEFCITQYMEFMEEIPSKAWHYRQLETINTLTNALKRVKKDFHPLGEIAEYYNDRDMYGGI